ncbi:MAG: hypothetical protein AMJ61_16580 [Desulfobacterales bacterium SG8_35_2]|nr:MAG: hypothetical protein AMJ61_16580 [Desulfobacterales bacterium SG8_35_2]
MIKDWYKAESRFFIYWKAERANCTGEEIGGFQTHQLWQNIFSLGDSVMGALFLNLQNYK